MLEKFQLVWFEVWHLRELVGCDGSGCVEVLEFCFGVFPLALSRGVLRHDRGAIRQRIDRGVFDVDFHFSIVRFPGLVCQLSGALLSRFRARGYSKKCSVVL